MEQYKGCTNKKIEEIDNNTYTVAFYKHACNPDQIINSCINSCSKNRDINLNKQMALQRTNYNVKEPSNVNEETDEWKKRGWKHNFGIMAKKFQGKKIIKIIIVAETIRYDSYLLQTLLTKSRFIDILDLIDFDNQILLIENTTCGGANGLCDKEYDINNLPMEKRLAKKDDCVEEVVKKYINDKYHDNKERFFYYSSVYNGDTDNYGQMQWRQKISSNGTVLDEYYIYGKTQSHIHDDTKAIIFKSDEKYNEGENNRYITSLYTDLQNLSSKNQLPKPEDKKVSPKNNGAKTDLAIPATTKEKEDNIPHGDQDKTETGMSNEGAFCDLKSGICCGCKLW